MIISPDNIQEILIEAKQKGLSYSEYRKLIKDLLAKDKVTGETQSQSFLDYTLLNEKRMDRWEKRFELKKDQIAALEEYKGEQTWLVISEGWCGDAAHVLPVLQQMTEVNSKISMKIVLRDEHENLMNSFLTEGARSIPKLIAIDDRTEEVIFEWGPRPSTLRDKVNEFKDNFGKITPEFRSEIQMWYNKDKGNTTVTDLLQLLSLK
ncbi:thioredoxin family protein [Robertkochia solimangrovi]|uniref:thioredoxin family protein n=1 Tax=Robertkochia solimangrovi TaxID=2213046 RepID=UPI0013A578CC|nr:thioredoxin family protein [Robertkochia solimangrovi]